MKLSEVWDYFDPDVKRVFTAVDRESDHARTKSVLGGLADLSTDTSSILREIETEADATLIHPEPLPDDPGECPNELGFSPCVKESLNFFRIHQLQPITVANLALRLLQIGTGDTVMTLERAGYLKELRERVQEQTET